MTLIKGLEKKSFGEMLELATIAEINAIPVYFIDYEKLILVKKAAKRSKDLLYIA